MSFVLADSLLCFQLLIKLNAIRSTKDSEEPLKTTTTISSVIGLFTTLLERNMVTIYY